MIIYDAFSLLDDDGRISVARAGTQIDYQAYFLEIIARHLFIFSTTYSKQTFRANLL